MFYVSGLSDVSSITRTSLANRAYCITALSNPSNVIMSLLTFIMSAAPSQSACDVNLRPKNYCHNQPLCLHQVTAFTVTSSVLVRHRWPLQGSWTKQAEGPQLCSPRWHMLRTAGRNIFFVHGQVAGRFVLYHILLAVFSGLWDFAKGGEVTKHKRRRRQEKVVDA